MSSKKTHDIAVKTGEYQDREGNTKGRWQNIGALMEGDDGNLFIVLERTFNPAGVPNPDSRASLIASCFKPQQGQNREEEYRNSSAGQRGYDRPSENPGDGLEDSEIPF